jgi:hypothetical protein
VTILAVDLAAKYSAACLMADDYTVIDQFDSWQISEDVFIRRLTAPWLMPNFDNDDPPPTSMVIEDLPHGLQYSTLVKTVCRLQGRIYHEMARDYQGRRVRRSSSRSPNVTGTRRRTSPCERKETAARPARKRSPPTTAPPI